jgi:mRNA interferase MazF
MVVRRGPLARILRGEVYSADLKPVCGHEQSGVRPVLILSHDVLNERSGTVIALAITGQPQRAGYPLTWHLPAGILPKESWVKISQIRTLSTERLGSRLGQLGDDAMGEIVDGLVQLTG